ncbi:HAMP domain-containing histidine kinase [bacterium]|nr:HAMP domain-containing histidine kinase [bacterium]
MAKSRLFIQHKERLLFVLLISSSILLTILFVMDLHRSAEWESDVILDGVLAILSYSLLIYLFITKQVEVTATLLTGILFFLTLILFAMAPQGQLQMLIWLTFMPLFMLNLLDFSIGRIWVIVLNFSLAILLLLIHFGFLPGVVHLFQLREALLAFVFFSLFATYFQRFSWQIRGLLSDKNNELTEVIEELKQAQQQLVESEKLASLGSLVAGVSHEVNTPLGIGLTGISQLKHEVAQLEALYDDETMTEEVFRDYLKTSKESAGIVMIALEKARDLIKSFKQISADQHSDVKRNFNLKQYVNEVVLSLKNELKQKQVVIHNNVDETIELNSYAGIYSQIITNLVMNAVKHAFDIAPDNQITIDGFEKDGILTILFSDNGKGISKEIEKKIFDPFFTTALGSGGSGLGLNIVYNLIYKTLGGTIKIDDTLEGQGLSFVIKIEEEIDGES